MGHSSPQHICQLFSCMSCYSSCRHPPLFDMVTESVKIFFVCKLLKLQIGNDGSKADFQSIFFLEQCVLEQNNDTDHCQFNSLIFVFCTQYDRAKRNICISQARHRPSSSHEYLYRVYFLRTP